MADEEASRELDVWFEFDRVRGLHRLRNMLRSDDALSRDVRTHLADMLDPTSRSTFRLDLKRRGKPGRPRKSLDADMGENIRRRRDELGEDFKNALHEVMKLHGVKRHSVVEALRVMRDTEDEPQRE